MGLISPRVYLDACIVIYLVEEHPLFGEPSRNAILSSVGRQFCLSPLVEMECLIHPLRNKNQGLIERYEMFFLKCLSLELTPEVYRTGAKLRADHMLKTPDALHLAAALFHDCGEVWTNDDRLTRAGSIITVNILDGKPRRPA